MRHRRAAILTLILSVALGLSLGARGLPLGARAQTTSPAQPSQEQPLRAPDVIYVPTPQEVVNAMLTLAGVTEKDVVYDLGCGDGRIPITAVKNFNATRAVGIDIDPQRIHEAEMNMKTAGVSPDKVRFINGDLFTSDISSASVVTLYLLPSLNLKLIPKLKSELKPGTRIVSHAFDMGDEWPPEKTEEVNGRRIFLWTIK